jgi:putative ABC transport system permease protein
MNLFGSDLRCAFRSLRKAPFFAVSATLSLAAGFGACVAVLSIVEAIYLSDLPFAKPEELVAIDAVRRGPGCQQGCSTRLTVVELNELASRLKHAADFGGAVSAGVRVTTPSGTTYQRVGLISGNLLNLLSVPVSRGRGIMPADGEAGAMRVAVLSHRFWQREFAADSGVTGKSFIVANESYRIVGVLADRAVIGQPITVDGDSSRAEFLVPAGTWMETTRLRPIARMRRGMTAEALRDQLIAAYPPSDDNRLVLTIVVTGLRTLHTRQYAGSYPLLLLGVGTMLAVVVANLAGLFLARISGRNDMSIRGAFGAGAFQMVRPFLLETALIASAGAVIGLGVALIITGVVRAAASNALPYWTAITIGGPTLAVAGAVLVVAWVAFGWIPAFSVVRARQNRPHGLTASNRSADRKVTLARHSLIAAEIAVSFALIVAGGLLFKTYFTALWRDTGVAANIVEVIIDPPWGGTGTAERDLLLADELSRDIRALPAVLGVGTQSIGYAPYVAGLTREWDREMIPAPPAPTQAVPITLGYFKASGLVILDGRDFATTDAQAASPVVILGDSAAKRLFPGRRAVGQRVKFGPPESPSPWLTVVGVVREQHCSRLLQACPYVSRMYRPSSQGFAAGPFYMRVRVTGDPESMISSIKRVVAKQGLSVETAQYGSVTRRIRRELAASRLHALVSGSFALCAAALAAFGVYGVTAYVVSLRRREIAIRVAVGASANHIRRLVLSDVAPTTGVGLALGAIISWGGSRMLAALIYGSSPNDPLVLAAAVGAVLIAVASGAYAPMRSANQVAPAEALHAE